MFPAALQKFYVFTDCNPALEANSLCPAVTTQISITKHLLKLKTICIHHSVLFPQHMFANNCSYPQAAQQQAHPGNCWAPLITRWLSSHTQWVLPHGREHHSLTRSFSSWSCTTLDFCIPDTWKYHSELKIYCSNRKWAKMHRAGFAQTGTADTATICPTLQPFPTAHTAWMHSNRRGKKKLVRFQQDTAFPSCWGAGTGQGE